MKYKFAGDAPSREEIIAHLSEALPGWTIGKQLAFVMAKKDNTYGCFVSTKKDVFRVVGNYPSPVKRGMFGASFVALGILPPLIWFMAARHKTFKATETEVANALQTKWPAV